MRILRLLPLALLGPLVACTITTLPEGLIFKGPAIAYCEIEKPSGRHCASAEEKARGIRLSAAAEALVSGQTSDIGLDDSPAAVARCNGEPEAVTFEGPFPHGTELCVDCSGPNLPDLAAACVQRCEALTAPGVTPVPPNVTASCQTRTRLSANTLTDANICYEGACTDQLMPDPSYADKRVAPEAVTWGDLIGVTVTGDTLTRTAPTPSDPQVFDAGAASSQTITKADGFVEFTAAETDRARLCGFSDGAPPDTDPTYQTIGFAIDVFKDGRYYVFENGVKAAGPDLNQSFGTYLTGQKFRIHVKDRFDGSASVTYATVDASCTDGKACPETVFYTSLAVAHYPIRVDSSFRDQGGTLANARLVRIR